MVRLQRKNKKERKENGVDVAFKNPNLREVWCGYENKKRKNWAGKERKNVELWKTFLRKKGLKR